MRQARRLRLGLLGLAGVALLLAGCGSRTLYQRYQAERLFWRAQRRAARLQLNPRVTRPADFQAAERAFAGLIRRFPARVWADSARLVDPYAYDVAVLSGRSAVALARLAELQGRDAAALAAYRRARHGYRAVLPAALEAAEGEARALERIGLQAQAIAAWEGIGTGFPYRDARTGQAVEGAMDAPLRAAEGAEQMGRRAWADSLLAAAAAAYRAALPALKGGPAGAPLLERLAAAEQRHGRPAAAAEAWRAVLAEPGQAARAQEVVLALGELWLDAGRPDSALAYAAWLGSAWPRLGGAQAQLLKARALEADGRTPEALAAYEEFMDRFPQHEEGCAFALQRRGALYEAQGRWELARTEYHTLAARFPASEEAMQALLHVTAHYVAAHDTGVARIEARTAFERLDGLVRNYRDTDVELLARRTRAELFLAVADWRGAFEALSDLWARCRETPLGEAAAFRAAAVAERQLEDRAGALRLYEEIAQRAASERGRAAARAEAERLRGREG